MHEALYVITFSYYSDTVIVAPCQDGCMAYSEVTCKILSDNNCELQNGRCYKLNHQFSRITNVKQLQHFEWYCFHRSNHMQHLINEIYWGISLSTLKQSKLRWELEFLKSNDWVETTYFFSLFQQLMVVFVYENNKNSSRRENLTIKPVKVF